MRFIILSEYVGPELSINRPIYVNTESIMRMIRYETTTTIELLNKTIYVIETPEEIISKIAQSNVNPYPSHN